MYYSQLMPPLSVILMFLSLVYENIITQIECVLVASMIVSVHTCVVCNSTSYICAHTGHRMTIRFLFNAIVFIVF